MQARGGHLERALDLLLALDVGEVRVHGKIGGGHRTVAREPGFVGRRGEVRAHLQQRAGRVDGGVRHEGRLVRVRPRQHEGARGRIVVGVLAQHRETHRERAAHGTQFSRQRQLAGEFVAVQRAGRDLVRRGEDAQRDRQIEAARFLGQLGRREVDGDAPARDLEARVLQRGAHAVFRFAHLGVRQSHDIHGRQTVGQMDFDADGRGFHAGQGAASEDGEAQADSFDGGRGLILGKRSRCLLRGDRRTYRTFLSRVW